MTDDELLRRPVIILGAPRSGTSVTADLFRHHPDLHLAGEPRILWKYGNDARSDALRPEHARPEVVRHIRAGLAEMVRHSGRTRLLEKTPSNALRVAFVNAVLPDAVFLHVIRDGEESALSIRSFWQNHSASVPKKMLMKRLREVSWRQAPHYANELARRVVGKLSGGKAGRPVWGPRPPGIDEMRRDLDLLEVCAWQWRMCVEHGCSEGRLLPPERYTEFRLSDLDESLLVRLMEFAGLAPAEEVLADFRERFVTDQVKHRGRSADPEDLARVSRYVAPTQAWLDANPLVERH